MRFVIYISPNGEDIKNGFLVYDDFGQLIGRLSSTDSFYSKLKKIRKKISVNFLCLKNEKVLNPKQEKFIKNIFCLLKIEKKELLILTFPDSLQTLPEKLCENIDIEKLFLPKSLKTIPEACFIKSEIKEIEFPETLEEIGEYAFANNKELEEVRLEKCKHLKKIKSNAFLKCQKLQRVNLVGCTEIEIGSFAFEDCKIKTLELPEGSILNENCFQLWYTENLRIPFTVNNMGTSVSVSNVFQNFETYGNVICFGFYENDEFNFEKVLPMQLLKNRTCDDYRVCQEISIEDCNFNRISNHRDFVCITMTAYKPTVNTKTFTRLYGEQKMLIPKRMLNKIFEKILESSKIGTIFNIKYKVGKKNFTLKLLDMYSYSTFQRFADSEELKYECMRQDGTFLIAHKTVKEDTRDFFATYYEKVNFLKKRKLKKNTNEGKIDELVNNIIFENKENSVSFEKIENYSPKFLIVEENKTEKIIPLVEEIDKLNDEISDENIISKELYELSKQIKEAYRFFENDFDKNKALKNKLENILPEILKTIESFIHFSNLPGCKNETEIAGKALELLISNTSNSIKFEIENEKMWRQLNLEAEAKALSAIVNNKSFKDELLKSKYDISFIEVLQEMGYKITDQNANCVILKSTNPVTHLIYLNLDEKLSIDLVINDILLNNNNRQFFENSYPEIFKRAREIINIVSKYKLN